MINSSINSIGSNSTNDEIDSNKRKRTGEDQNDNIISKKSKTEGDLSEKKVEALAQIVLDEECIEIETSNKSFLDFYSVKEHKAPWHDRVIKALEKNDWDDVNYFLEDNFFVKNVVSSFFTSSPEDALEVEESCTIDINLPFTEGVFKGCTLFYVVASQGQWNIANKMLKIPKLNLDTYLLEGVNLGITPLFFATLGGPVGLAVAESMLNLDSTLNINAYSLNGPLKGSTPISCASIASAWTLVEKMLDLNPGAADVNACADGQQTPLWNACHQDRWKIVEKMLDCPNPNVNASPETGPFAGITPLFLAMGDIFDDQGRPPLKMLDVCPSANINAFPLTGPDKGSTPLLWAIFFVNDELVYKMLDQHPDANIHACFSEGERKGKDAFVLILTNSRSTLKWEKIEQDLIKKIVNMPNFNPNHIYQEGPYKGLTPFWVSVSLGRWDIVKILLNERDVNLDAVPLPTDFWNSQRFLIEKKDIECELKIPLQNVWKLFSDKYVLEDEKAHLEAVTCAAILGAWDVVEEAIDKYPNINYQGVVAGKNLFSLILMSLSHWNLKKWHRLEKILDLNTEIDVTKNYETKIFIDKKNIEIAEVEVTFLTYLAINEQWDLLNKILDSNLKFEINASTLQSETKGKTLLFYVLKAKQLDLAERILDLGLEIDVNKGPKGEKNSLWLAAKNEYWDLVEKMLDQPNPNVHYSPNSGSCATLSVLNLAANSQQWKLVEKMLSFKSPEVQQIQPLINQINNDFDDILTEDKIDEMTILINHPEREFQISKKRFMELSTKFERMLQIGTLEGKESKVGLTTDKYEEKDVLTFVKFLQSDKILIGNDNVFALFFLADEHEINSLRQQCLDYLKKHLSLDGVFGAIQFGCATNDNILIWIALSCITKEKNLNFEEWLYTQKNLKECSSQVIDFLLVIKVLLDQGANLGEFGEITLQRAPPLEQNLFYKKVKLHDQLDNIEEILPLAILGDFSKIVPLSLTIKEKITKSQLESIANLCSALKHLTIECDLDMNSCKDILINNSKLESFGNVSQYFKGISEVENFSKAWPSINLNSLCLEDDKLLNVDLEKLAIKWPELEQLYLKNTNISKIPFEKLKKIDLYSCSMINVLSLETVQEADLFNCEKLSEISLPSVIDFTAQKIGVIELSLPNAKLVSLIDCMGDRREDEEEGEWFDLSKFFVPLAEKVILEKCNYHHYYDKGIHELVLPMAKEILINCCNSLKLVRAPSAKSFKYKFNGKGKLKPITSPGCKYSFEQLEYERS